MEVLKSITDIDTFDITHKVGVMLIFIIAMITLWTYFSLKKRPVKSKSKSPADGIHHLHQNALILFGIFIAVIATLFLNGIWEILAGLIVIFLALWLSEMYPDSKK